MAAVLTSEYSNHFISSSMRRSQSQSNLVAAPASYRQPNPNIHSQYAMPSKSYAESDHSSAPSSPPPVIQAESTDISFSSTPASNLSIASEYDEALAFDETSDDHFNPPLLSQDKFFLPPTIQHDDNLEPPPSPKTGDSYTVSPAEPDTSGVASGPDTPECPEHAEDDSAVSSKPSRQVDYLSHEWKEEDIWSSWRYIISKRDEFPNSKRLENASWRTWMKAKNKLKTISPEELNWLKDCDVTWLYGPLQSGSNRLNPTQTEPSSSTLSKSESLVNLNKKPILKKRSMSELMLQRSITAASLLKQATAAVQAQETRKSALRPNISRANTDCYVTYPLSTRRLSQGNNSSVAQSTDSSGMSSPFPERKHIHFNEQVEQCIAVEVKGDEDDDVDMDRYDEGSDSDDGGVMMKRVKAKKRGPSSKRKTKKVVQPEGKTIAKLPSTTLKYREDTPELDSAMKHSTGVYRSPILSPSSSQETLRPTKQPSDFYFGEEDDDMEDAPDASAFGWRSPPGNGLSRSTSTGSLCDEPVGMRRTPSGMFMPCEEGDPSAGDGILGRVIDTVNTARDIAHVIWNVGWRK
ncbi:protein phosphatase regulator [Purpureocillium takamizusanense]|uniref:Protein phosphatase regulator n=1 Tax=Purpureocillium takamizusanense TaxID=2060973 RepID=A0A9Q8V830_9HYPO|nr:protein phosphatase regulator [Purpureocillium takamizusanense]UNI15126.1 protein phosphatase regulator [Purpureocillium takamizusanense]